MKVRTNYSRDIKKVDLTNINKKYKKNNKIKKKLKIYIYIYI